MNRIKIIHILHSVGGVDTSLRMILENIDSSKFENIVIHGKKDNSDFLDNNENKVKEYKLPIERNISPIKDLRSIIGSWKILKKEQPDIVHVHSAKGGIIGNILGYFSKNKTVLHTPQAYSFLSTQNSLKKRLYIFIERLVKNRNSMLLASSNSELNRGLNEVKYAKEKTLLFNNSIDQVKLNPEYKNISEYNLPENFICTVGRPSYQKNIEMMVEVIKEVKKIIPNIHLVLMGVGVVSPNTESVINLIAKYKLETNFTLIDWVEREKIFHIVAKAQFYVSTARYEGLPYAIIESLSLSKAIIATDCDGNRDLVINNHNGFLINKDSVNFFAEKIIELQKNKELRETFEKKSFALFQDKFNIASNIKNLEQIYTDFS